MLPRSDGDAKDPVFCSVLYCSNCRRLLGAIRRRTAQFVPKMGEEEEEEEEEEAREEEDLCK